MTWLTKVENELRKDELEKGRVMASQHGFDQDNPSGIEDTPGL